MKKYLNIFFRVKRKRESGKRRLRLFVLCGFAQLSDAMSHSGISSYAIEIEAPTASHPFSHFLWPIFF